MIIIWSFAFAFIILVEIIRFCAILFKSIRIKKNNSIELFIYFEHLLKCDVYSPYIAGS